MRFSLSAVLLAAASSVVAQTPHFDVMISPAQGATLQAGSTGNITWQNGYNVPAGSTITITLLQGTAFTLLEKGPVVASGVLNTKGYFAWPVPSANHKAYGFNITLDSDPSIYQLSNGFYIAGTTSSSSAPAYPTSGLTTATVTLLPGPSYTASTSTTTPSAYIPKYNATSSANTTWAKPTTVASQTVPAVVTTAVSSSVSTSASASPIPNAAGANAATGGLVLIGGLLLALAL